jgi:hypothetical protein
VSFLFEKLRLAWKKVAEKPKKEPDEIDTFVNLVLQMAKLMHIDPQQIVDVMQTRLEVKEMTEIDPDIDAVVKTHLHDRMLDGGIFYVE